MRMARTRPQRHIVVLGGGGFSYEQPEDARLDDYTLALTGKRKPRVCFLPTASGDSVVYIERFLRRFPAQRAEAVVLRLFTRDGRDLEEFILNQDVIYVGGGNTANALAVWRVHGVDRLLRKAWMNGTVMTGVSAGMLCWFEGGVTDSFGPLAALPDGLGVLRGSACPHYDAESRRRPTYHDLVGQGDLPGGYAADDWAALHFAGRSLHAVVASMEGKCGYRVERVGGKAIERRIEARVLRS